MKKEGQTPLAKLLSLAHIKKIFDLPSWSNICIRLHLG